MPGPSSAPGPLSASGHRAFARPGAALAIGGVGFVLAVLVTTLYTQAWRPSLLALPPAVLALLDLVVVLAPYVAAVVVALVWARGTTGLRGSSLLGILVGLFLGILARGVTELLAPTTGSLTGAFIVDADAAVVAGLVVTIIGAVLISPLVEELFFRGLLQRVTAQLAGSTGGLAVAASVTVSVVTFVAAHLLVSSAAAWGSELAATLPLGLAAALATAYTRGIGAALTAHIVFNLGGVLLLLV